MLYFIGARALAAQQAPVGACTYPLHPLVSGPAVKETADDRRLNPEGYSRAEALQVARRPCCRVPGHIRAVPAVKAVPEASLRVKAVPPEQRPHCPSLKPASSLQRCCSPSCQGGPSSPARYIPIVHARHKYCVFFRSCIHPSWGTGSGGGPRPHNNDRYH